MISCYACPVVAVCSAAKKHARPIDREGGHQQLVGFWGIPDNEAEFCPLYRLTQEPEFGSTD